MHLLRWPLCTAAITLGLTLGCVTAGCQTEDDPSSSRPNPDDADREGGGGFQESDGATDGSGGVDGGRTKPDGAPFVCPTIDPDSLRAKTSGTFGLVGAAVSMPALTGDPLYATTLAKEFNYVTAENAMKWGETQTGPTSWVFGPADYLVDFAEEHCMKVKGHALVWHTQLPTYVNDAMTPAQLKAAMIDHITTLVGRYKGRIRAWDVVNEAVGDNGAMRPTIFYNKLGEDFIKDAFDAAHAADPQAELIYNDYLAEDLGTKSNLVYALEARLKAAGAPIHGVGLQMHATSTLPVISELPANMARLAALGLKVNVSELDYRTQAAPVSTLADERKAFNHVAHACRTQPACEGVTFWGFTDKYSWIDGFFGPDDPLPFDDNIQRKGAYAGFRAGLEGTKE